MLEKPMQTEPMQTEPTPALLDEDYLSGLARHLGTAHACELLADGMIDMIGRLERLAEVARGGDSGAIAALSHEIAGASGHLGLALVSHYAARASHASRCGGDPLPWIEALMGIRSASIGALRDYCAAGRQEVESDPGLLRDGA
jgi:hypothetical protein